ncbi:hypothetical protein FACS189481_3290 [Clostridia bacterium]|nr:hypothetical protein FACS189481_3290 [Clostridia bacterium]
MKMLMGCVNRMMDMFLPDYVFNKIWDISEEDIKGMGVKFLLLDIDNTLTEHNGKTPRVEALKWLKKLKEVGIDAAIVSNGRAKRVKEFAGVLGLQYEYSSRKPLRVGFKNIVERLGWPKSETAIIGDQIYTDVLGGNAFGIKTILVCPIEVERRLFLRLKRILEKPFLKRAKRRGAVFRL